MRPSISLAIALTAALLPSPARADEVEACVRAADEGQALRDQGKLGAAKDRFVTCSREGCPGLVRADCAGWLADVTARQPSVVLGATDADARDLLDASVSIDGGPPAPLDGRARPLDPGPHRLRFTRPAGAAEEVTVVLREGERGRAITARFPRAIAPAEPAGPSRAVVVPAVALGAVALVGAGMFAGLGISAKRDFDHLRDTCAPHCAADLVAPVRAKEIAANVALGAGIAAAAAAIVVLIVRPGSRKAAWSMPRAAIVF